jgi:hypothetical protein
VAAQGEGQENARQDEGRGLTGFKCANPQMIDDHPGMARLDHARGDLEDPGGAGPGNRFKEAVQPMRAAAPRVLRESARRALRRSSRTPRHAELRQGGQGATGLDPLPDIWLDRGLPAEAVATVVAPIKVDAEDTRGFQSGSWPRSLAESTSRRSRRTAFVSRSRPSPERGCVATAGGFRSAARAPPCRGTPGRDSPIPPTLRWARGAVIPGACGS